ncbi:MAG: T9SS type A sorting domain-containing protein, partial [Bacteroidales bacterium]|nr:T9SS type A sorting domain-containing protein [Bacteroidales bacterium]
SFENMGHFVSSIDMSLDGSLIAAATWGPVNNSTPDFFLFEKNSNEAIFTINSPGYIRHTDLSSDGTICALSGKAIHETTFGNGGTIYCVNTDLTPSAPDNIFIQYSENLAAIFWDMPEILDFDHFNIYSSYDNGEFVLLGSITDTVYNFTMPLEGFYQFYVTTVDLADQESEDSEIVSCTFGLTSTQNNIDISTNFLSQNTPNPFHSSTAINYSITVDEKVSIEIYDIHGRKINTLVNEHQKSGNYSVVWDGTNEKGRHLNGGIYFYSLKSKNNMLLKKMILMN